MWPLRTFWVKSSLWRLPFNSVIAVILHYIIQGEFKSKSYSNSQAEGTSKYTQDFTWLLEYWSWYLSIFRLTDRDEAICTTDDLCGTYNHRFNEHHKTSCGVTLSTFKQKCTRQLIKLLTTVFRGLKLYQLCILNVYRLYRCSKDYFK